MTDSPDPVALLERSVGQAATVVGGVRKDQADLPTPCPAWTVGQLIDHLIGDLQQFKPTSAGVTADAAAGESDPNSGDWSASFHTGGTELIDAWRDAGDLDQTIQLPGMGEVPKRFRVDMATAEFAMHTWDLICASGQKVDLDPEIATAALAWATATLRPEYRSTEPDATFRPAVPIADDAPVYDRLAAFAGRPVS